MIKKILLLALIVTIVVAAELKPMNLAKPRFDGDGDYNKQFVLKSLVNKSPQAVFTLLKRPINIHEKDSVGFPNWKFTKCEKTGEHLASYDLVIVNERQVLEGRHIWSLKLDFYRDPAKGIVGWKCWDAYYTLLPKGVDWHRANEKE